MMALDQLAIFMGAMRRIESNSFDGNYRAVNRSSGARGAYQIMPGNWAGWAAQAGIPGADWRDPNAQDTVARFKFIEYFRRYKRWDLVAMAWFGGEGAVKSYLKGDQKVNNRSDGNTTIGNYVKLVDGYMTEYAGMQPGATPGEDFLDQMNDRALQGAQARGMTGPDGLGQPGSAGQPWFYPMYLSPDDQLASYFGSLTAQEPEAPVAPKAQDVLRQILQGISNGVKGQSGSGMEAPPSELIDASQISDVGDEG